MGIKEFFLKKMFESKMKDVPKEEQEKMFAMIEKDPELFQKIAIEMQEEMKKGGSEMEVAMKVAAKYKEDISRLMK